ncbi:hypothetical protein KPL70_006185 [Citrus sinensis]|uniref:Beta-glucosidase n=1 Tax=Citrus clementina TaxID=85681 RepID=V4VKQ9_CITCL|nr:hypothetical protein CICLE_v10023663mg [Citrus x clementina]KAH9720770.1 hypothetical protein KPL70_006185 [Citrus sinensis]
MGVTEKRNDTLAIDAALKDQHRISFILRHLYRIRRAIEKGANVKGYFYWTLFDDFEWSEGFKYLILDTYFYYTDYKNNPTRIPKDSAKWFHAFIKGQGQASHYYIT